MAELLEDPRVVAFDSAVDDALDLVRGNRIADRFFYALTESANHSILWHSLTWLPVLLKPARWKRAACISAALGAESAIVNGPVKMLFRRERPLHETQRPHRLRKPKSSSFPSGHATSAMCAAALLSDAYGKKPFFYALAPLVALSRAYVRIHHASDIVAGALFGTAFGAVARRIVRRLNA